MYFRTHVDHHTIGDNPNKAASKKVIYPHHCAVRAELVEAQAALRQAQGERGYTYFGCCPTSLGNVKSPVKTQENSDHPRLNKISS
jgi:hypothetical protein